jgi:hypothetical protein
VLEGDKIIKRSVILFKLSLLFSAGLHVLEYKKKTILKILVVRFLLGGGVKRATISGIYTYSYQETMTASFSEKVCKSYKKTPLLYLKHE